MKAETVHRVTQWFNRMRDNAERAVTLSKKIITPLYTMDNDLVWAVVKYTENVQESARELEKINDKIFPGLVEIGKKDWRDLIGMRIHLMHKFWDIDPAILLQTVERDFPILLSLLKTTVVAPEIVRRPDQAFSFQILTEGGLLNLPETPEGSDPKAGRSLVVMSFNADGDVSFLRVGHRNGGLVLSGSHGAYVGVWGKRKRPG